MKIGVQIFVTPKKAITIESDEHGTIAGCMDELIPALDRLSPEKVRNELTEMFGAD